MIVRDGKSIWGKEKRYCATCRKVELKARQEKYCSHNCRAQRSKDNSKRSIGSRRLYNNQCVRTTIYIDNTRVNCMIPKRLLDSEKNWSDEVRRAMKEVGLSLDDVNTLVECGFSPSKSELIRSMFLFADYIMTGKWKDICKVSE